tara:strand:- start:7 stop:318 length:312 start_codon:yes stop_codon:yes gene_type:complete
MKKIEIETEVLLHAGLPVIAFATAIVDEEIVSDEHYTINSLGVQQHDYERRVYMFDDIVDVQMRFKDDPTDRIIKITEQTTPTMFAIIRDQIEEEVNTMEVSS